MWLAGRCTCGQVVYAVFMAGYIWEQDMVGARCMVYVKTLIKTCQSMLFCSLDMAIGKLLIIW